MIIKKNWTFLLFLKIQLQLLPWSSNTNDGNELNSQYFWNLIYNLEAVAACLKIFMGLALVHFQKYWLLNETEKAFSLKGCATNDKFCSFISQLLSSFDGSFWQSRSFNNSISFSSKFLTKKRIKETCLICFEIKISRKRKLNFLKERFRQKLLSKQWQHLGY